MSVGLVIAQVVRLAIPYLFAAAGGVVAERAGVMSLTLEGFMLGGAFGAALGGSLTGSAWGGVAGGVVGGGAFALVHALACIRFSRRPGGDRHRDQHPGARPHSVPPPTRLS